MSAVYLETGGTWKEPHTNDQAPTPLDAALVIRTPEAPDPLALQDVGHWSLFSYGNTTSNTNKYTGLKAGDNN